MRNENPLAELPDTGHQGQKSAEPISELNSDVMDEERPSLPGWEAGWSSRDRVIGLSRERILIAHIWSYYYNSWYEILKCH